MPEKTNQARCLQEITGSCGGCPIQNLVAEKLVRTGANQMSGVVERIGKEYCPEGNTIQMPEIPKQSIW